jgi:hypothetical protein
VLAAATYSSGSARQQCPIVLARCVLHPLLRTWVLTCKFRSWAYVELAPSVKCFFSAQFSSAIQHYSTCGLNANLCRVHLQGAKETALSLWAPVHLHPLTPGVQTEKAPARKHSEGKELHVVGIFY